MTYVAGTGPAPGCIFCLALAASDDRRLLLLARTQHAFLILNAYPYTPGHLMAVLTRHIGSLNAASGEELGAMMALVQRATEALREEYRADGFNIGLNEGRVAGAGVEGHLHMHVVPRWNGDSNFMPVIGETRVLPEGLDATYDRLRGRLVG
jgi:ATP adenylyltransferase